MSRRVVAAIAALFGALPAQQRAPCDVVLDVAADAEARCRALAELQVAGALDVPTALAVLGGADETVAATAAAIVRHSWPVLPPELLQGLDGDPAAARRFLRELAVAPRPAAAAWSETRIAEAPGRLLDDRCLALAARGRPLTAADADPLLRALAAGDTGEGWRAAVQLLPSGLADQLVGRVHALLLQAQIDVAAAVPLFERTSGVGVQQLLGIAATLPLEVGEAICDHTAQRDPAAVRERARAALDGEAPLEALWLRYAAPLLDRPERRERLLAALQDAAAPMPLQQRAYEALLAAHVDDARLVRWALAGDGERLANLARLLDAEVDALPASLLADWLVADPELARLTVRALVRRRELGPEIERVLLQCFAGAVAEGPFLPAAATALLQCGSEAAVAAVWPQLRSSTLFGDYVDTLARRRAPFVHQLLLLELDADPAADVSAAVRDRQLDAVRLGLVAQGDLRQLGRLVDHAPRATPTFVRRCAHHARPLAAPLALQLLDRLPDVTDVDLAGELAAWAASCGDDEVLVRMQRLWRADGDSEMAAMLREVALRALAQGPARTGLVATLRAALAAGPLPEVLEPLPFELIATMAEPPAADDLLLLAELALRPPLADPQRERELAARWPDGRYGFPVLAAIGRRLLGSDPAIAARPFAEVAAAIAADPRHEAVSRQRLLVLWRVLERDRDLQRAVGAATAALCLSVPAADGLADGPAHWFLQHAAAGRADFAGAAQHARAAIGGLLWSAAQRSQARLFLGERDPGAGDDPWAALAAAPHRYDLLAARAAGDAAAAAHAAALVREFAGHDRATLAALDPPPAKDPIR